MFFCNFCVPFHVTTQVCGSLLGSAAKVQLSIQHRMMKSGEGTKPQTSLIIPVIHELEVSCGALLIGMRYCLFSKKAYCSCFLPCEKMM